MKKSFNLPLNSRTLEREMPKFKGVRLNLIMFNKLKMLPSDSKWKDLNT